MASKIQVRRDTLSNWNANNPVLSSGEIAFVTDENKFKVGNGSSAFSSLPYLQADAYIDSVILGTDTTGNYVETMVSGNGISLSGQGSESASVTVTNTGVLSLSGTTNEVEVSASTGNITVSLPSTINANTTGTAASLTTARTIALSGDISGSASFDGSASVDIVATIQPDSVALGSDTTGNYVSQVTGSGAGISVTGSGESASVTIENTGVTSLSGTTNEVEVSASTGSITISLPSTINANTTGSAATLTNARAIALSGDVSGSANFDGSASISINAEIQPNSVALGTDTTGNYVATVTGTPNQVSVSGSGSENAEVTLSLPSTINVNTSGNAATATQLANSRTIALSGDVSGSVTFDGSASVNITTTIQPDSVTLGTDTTGNYVATATAGAGISISGSGSENAAITISNTGVRSLTGTANQISVSASNGDTILSLPSAVTFPGTVTLNADPTQALHAATKQYVDAVAEGLHIHASVATATTASVDLSNAPTAIDGVNLTDGMRVLVKNQSNTADNGIYTYSASADALVRASDFNSTAEIQGGDFLFVTGGNTYADTGWVQTEKVTTLGTDPILFTQFSGAGTYSAGVGLQLDGTVFSNTGVLSLAGTTNEVEVSASSGSVTISLPSTINANTTGSAATLTTSRTIALTGDVTGSATFNGGANASISSTLANTAVTPATYGSASAVGIVTVDSKGRITGASNTPIAVAQSAVANLTTDLGLKANLASPALTGTPTAPTAAVDTNTTQIATTAFVLGQANSTSATITALGTQAAGTSNLYARADHVHPTTGLGLTSGKLSQFAATTSAELAGVISDETGSGALVFATSPTLVTPDIGVATGTSFNSITGLSSTTPVMNGTAAVGTGTTVARADHVHPTDTSRAPLASPTFTGTVTIPTLSLTTADTTTAASHYMVEVATDGVVRPKTLANVQTEIVTTAAVNAAAATTVGTITSGTWNATNIALNRGGTNASLTAANGAVVYSTASALALTSVGTAGQVLTSNGAGAPTWQEPASGGFDGFFLAGL